MEHHMIVEGKETEYNGKVVQVSLVTLSGLLVYEHERSIAIIVPSIARSEVVTVYKPDLTDIHGNALPARINWSGCGSQGIDETHYFIEALNLAKTYAEELNKVYGVKAVE